MEIETASDLCEMETAIELGVDASEQRLVHLDLKGAPPKINYYEWLFPLLRKWGATGLLVEYEDMFPYTGILSDVASKNAYSPSDVKLLQSVAKHNQLAVIPLVQTFGHFEFVLKHDKMRHLREVEQCPMTLCPSLEESFNIVTQMIDQVITLHPDITSFHIGADEVFHIGLCTRCLEKMELTSSLPVDLFLGHIRRVLTYLHTTYPRIHLIMWDDMFRKISLHTLQGSGIGDLVEPMVWYYQATINLSPDTWSLYSQVFKSIWVASAFKGATGPCMVATDIGYHVENQKDWLNVARNCIKPLGIKLSGYALTGWQRYDHYAILCELLPVGLPSLAICLLTISTGAFTVEVHRTASEDLGFKDIMLLNPFTSFADEIVCQFKGSDIFRGVHTLLQLKAEYKFFTKNERLKGWMTNWHLRNNYTNPAHISHFVVNGQQLLHSLEQLSKVLEAALSDVFYPDTVEEWMSINVLPMVEKLRSLVEKANQQIAIGGRIKNHPGFVTAD